MMKSDDSTSSSSSSEPKHAPGAEEHNDELDWWQFRLLHKGEKQLPYHHNAELFFFGPGPGLCLTHGHYLVLIS